MRCDARGRLCGIVAVWMCWLLGSAVAMAQEGEVRGKKSETEAKTASVKAAPAAEQALVTRVYDVADLVVPKPAYPYQGNVFGGGYGSSGGYGAGGFGGMGGMGGMGGGAGGGFFNVQDNPNQPAAPAEGGAAPAAPRPVRRGEQPATIAPGMIPPTAAADQAVSFTIADLTQAIKEAVEPSTWNDVGGPGSIARLGGMLIISQTPAVQEKVQKFLESIRETGAGQKIVTLRARWLLLGAKQLQQLTQGKPAKDGAIDRAALDSIAAKSKGYQGEISCFDGQTVHIVSGRNKSLVVNAIPVVGGGEPAYQPVIAAPQTGLLLQVTPHLLPKAEAVVLDLHSVFTQLGDSGGPFTFLSSKSQGGDRAEAELAGAGRQPREKTSATPDRTTLTLDRMNLVVQQLATTIRAPLGQTVLVGGLTLEPPTDATWTADEVPQLYLFVEATAR